jgi:hypothetical protein
MLLTSDARVTQGRVTLQVSRLLSLAAAARAAHWGGTCCSRLPLVPLTWGYLAGK